MKGLLECGAREVYGLPGGEVLTLMEAGRRMGLPFILTRHESAASFMADVTGQVTGRPGICLSTLGPGASNMVTGVANAYLDRSPVIAITGQMAADAYSVNPHQRLDLCALYRPVTKWSIKVTPENAAVAMEAAIKVALCRPRGPVHVELASTVSAAEAVLPGSFAPGEEPPMDEQESTLTCAQVLKRLERAKYPALLVGINVDPGAIAGPLRDIAERCNIPVLLSAKAKGVFPHDHPLFVGVATGMAADDRVMQFITECDLILGVGFDASEADQAWPATAPIVWLEESPRDRAELEGDYLIDSPGAVLQALAQGYQGQHKWTSDAVEAARRGIREKVVGKLASAGVGLSPSEALMAIRGVLPEDGALVCDVGAHKLLAGQAWPSNEPQTFFLSNGLSSMGYGLPAAIAVKNCLGPKPVVAVVGDGGLGMMIQEIETAVRMRQGVVCVVFNDRCLSLIQVAQSKRKLEQYGVDLLNTCWASAAKAFGAKGVQVSSLDELVVAVKDGISGDCPTIIDVPVNGGEYALRI